MKLILAFAIAITGGIVTPVFAHQDGTSHALANQCLKSAAQEFKVPLHVLVSMMDQVGDPDATADCKSYRDQATLLSASLKDSNGDLRTALTRIHAGPTGLALQKALAMIASRG